jgi:RimJ/RimL family protein N-acetyltransferase
MEDLTIRQAISTDIHALASLDHNYSTEHVWQMSSNSAGQEVGVTFREVRLPRPMRANYPHNPKMLVDIWTHFAGLLIAEAGESKLGYISINEGPAPSSGWVRDLVVGQRHRRQGVATRLLQSACHWSSERGFTRIFIETQSKNVPAIRLVKKMNFVFAGYSDHYYPDQEIALFFAMDVR